MRLSYILCFICIVLVACKQQKTEYEVLHEMYKKPSSQWPAPFVEDTIAWKELGVLPKPNYPNGEKPSKQLLELGKKLFFDPRLSQTNQLACVSCHHPNGNYTDNLEKSMGFMLKQGKRNAPTVLNLSYDTHFFWDGRASSYQEQALGPLQSNVEMNTTLDTVVAHVAKIKGYREAFKKVLGKEQITINDITYALAMFQRSLISRKSKFDYFLLGTRELSPKELKGLHLFRTKGRCMNCHHGNLFKDGQFHNLGLTYYKRKYEDLGRYIVTKKASDIGKFKTPSLRDVMRTRPWMHNGMFDNMEGILNMYSAGMPRPKPRKGMEGDSLFPKTSPLLKQVNFTPEDKEALIAFLECISAPAFRISTPKLPE